MAYTVILEGGAPWGFRLQGGREFDEQIKIAKINPNSKAYNQGLGVGDYVDEINGDKTQGLMHNDALQLIRNASTQLTLQLRKGDLSCSSPVTNGPANGDINHNTKLNGLNSQGVSKAIFSTSALDNDTVHFVAEDDVIPLDGDDMSGSSSDSQGSIIRAAGPYRPPPSKAPRNYSPKGSPQISHKPTSTVWSPFGQQRTVAYRPMSFNRVGVNPALQRRPEPSQHPDNTAEITPSSPKVTSTYRITMDTSSDHSRTVDESKTSTSRIRLTSSGEASPKLTPRITTASPKLVHNGPASPSKQGVVWSPGGSAVDSRQGEEERMQEKHRQMDREAAIKDTHPVWSPTGGSTVSKKEFRPVRLDMSTSPTKELRSPLSPTSPKPEESYAWKPPERATGTTTVTTSTVTRSQPATTTNSSSSTAQWNGTISHFAETKSGLPPSQSPTITLLQKNREGQIPKGAAYMRPKEAVERDVSMETEVTTTTTKSEKKKVFPGVGPTDQSGMPIAPRMSIEEDNQKDWYKRMFKSLNTTEKPKEINTYKPTYVFPDSESEAEKEGQSRKKGTDHKMNGTLDRLDRYSALVDSALSPGGTRSSWSPPHARYRNEVYKNQPRSIMDYEPGFSSIAFRESKVDDEAAAIENQLYNPPIDKPGQFSRYTYNDSNTIVKRSERSLSPQSDPHDVYKKLQKGGEIPISGLGLPYPEKREGAAVRHIGSTSDMRARSLSADELKRREENEAKWRREQMEKIYAEERRRKMAEEQANVEARRHHDIYTRDSYWLELAGLKDLDLTGPEIYIMQQDSAPDVPERPSQKSPIPPASNRFEEGLDASGLQRPKKKLANHMRGKGKALYSFNAQNPRELSFRKNDVIYLLRHIDQNWYEGEHHGRIGIFPVNYVEVITSIESARQTALQKEGAARARYTFNAQTSVELPLRKGDIVQLIRRIDENWYEGRVGNRQGIFPVAYVEVDKEPDTPMITPMSSVAHTPRTGSPGQLSPVSTISNGPAPTIPEAPSPRGFDQFDSLGQLGYYNQAYSGDSSRASSLRPGSQMSARHDFELMSPMSQHSDMMSPYGQPQTNGHSTYDRKYNSLPGGYSSGTRNGGYVQNGNMHNGHSSSHSSSHQADRGSSRRSYGQPKEVYNRGYRSEEPVYPRYRAKYRYLPQNEDELELEEGDIVLVMEKCDDGWYVGTSDRTKEFGTFPGNYVMLV